MNQMAVRWEKVADDFAERVCGVPEGAWEDPAPCEGWVARDVVSHLAAWVPGYFGSLGVDFPDLPDDPVAAWGIVDATIRSHLVDPAMTAREFDTQLGRMGFDDAIGAFVLGDVLVHTWDLARATGQDERLDADEVHAVYESMLPADEMIRGEHFGPKVDVPDDADEQTKLLAFVGRHP
ncbi:MAG TPA: TIGR03086 family metal-binding protein [Acidimicrobiales bacterium]|nr:TIGR03086 family metal-binding protein [Acidimicrobiales bacterium]